MGLFRLISQVVQDNICSAAVVSRRLSSRVVMRSTLETDKQMAKNGGEEEILKAFDRVEKLEARIFGRYNSED